MLLPTSLVGSYPQPDWLIDRSRLAGRFPPRVRARELWRVAPEFLDQAQDDATVVAIRAQEDAGLDIITDGEIRRESYSNRFATALESVDIDNPGTALDRSGHPNPVPRVVGPIRRKHPVEVSDLSFLRDHTSRTIKITVPGPFTMAQQAQDDYYGSREALAFGYAEAVNEEIKDLFAAGADIVQLDEPYLQARSAEAAQYGVKVINRALDGVTGLGKTALHICFGYAAIIHERPAGYSFLPELAACDADQISVETAQSNLDCSALSALEGKTIILGVIDLSDPEVETPEVVVERVRRALPYVPASRLVLAPDCGMKYIPRETANGKMAALAAAAARLRPELSLFAYSPAAGSGGRRLLVSPAARNRPVARGCAPVVKRYEPVLRSAREAPVTRVVSTGVMRVVSTGLTPPAAGPDSTVPTSGGRSSHCLSSRRRGRSSVATAAR
jgi:5-methyltetrahydropteroyltriglutamate--homocysteine methyltransferase